jgi:hypothetical protein
MSRREDRRGRGDGEEPVGGSTAVPGRALRSAARYGSSAPAPTIDDAATAAVEAKGAGRTVDAAVAARVGAHLGADLSGVRVHDDPLSRAATQAMAARAFAYGGDVFLGPGERGDDLGLMAHELTHVVQQGAAGQRIPQRQVTVGAADSPAERQADQVAADVTGGARPAAVLVDDGPVQPGQMLKSTFIDQLRGQVVAAADEELGPVYSAIGCPYIETYFSRYSGQPAAIGEALLRRYAPAARDARTAQAMIPAVVARIREGIRAWRDTGQPPADIAAAEPAAAQASAPVADTPPVAAAMGAAQPLDQAAAQRIGDAYGASFADVRVHTGPEAARFADAQGATAVTIGKDIAFGAGAYEPGTSHGDALLAHELAHVQQQGGEARAMPRRVAEDPAAESDADHAAVGAMRRVHGGASAVAERARAQLSTGLALQRCSKKATPAAAVLTPVERGLDGQTPFTQALAEQAMTSYGGLSAADRAAWITRWSPRGHISDMTHALARADTAVGGRFENTLRDILQRTQRSAALDQAHSEGLADEAAMAQAQASEMITRNTAAAAAALPAGAPPPTTAQVSAQQQGQVSQTSIAPQTRTLTPAREATLTTAASAAVTSFVTWVTGAHPELHITAAHFRVAVREIWDRGDGIIAFADQGGAPRCVVGESFTQAATANPAYALPTVVHELWGHNEYGPYGQPGTEQGLEIYDRAAALMPGYVRPADGTADRTSEIDAYAYQETEMYSLMREVEFYTPNAPADRAALDSINYDPAPTISTRIGLIKTQFEARVARSIVRGLYQRYRMDPRLVPAAIAAFTAGVRANFSAPEATQILR